MAKHTKEEVARIYSKVAAKNALPPLFVIPREVKAPVLVKTEPQQYIEEKQTITAETPFAEVFKLFLTLSNADNYNRKVRVEPTYSGDPGHWVYPDEEEDDESWDDDTDETKYFVPPEVPPVPQSMTVFYVVRNWDYEQQKRAFKNREKEYEHQMQQHQKRKAHIEHLLNSNAQLIKNAISAHREDWVAAAKELKSKE